jgi:zinc protease
MTLGARHRSALSSLPALALAALAWGGTPGAVAAQDTGAWVAADGAGHAGVPGDLPFEAYELENGLKVILAPDPGATAVAVNLWYDVGSRHERPGRSGFAHLFEHLMFQGSERVGEGEHFQYVERAGGNLNASITEDRTNFYQTLPPERMNLGLWLEADRMRSLRITGEKMEREVEVVKEERRLSFDNAPYGGTQLQAYYYAPYDSASCFAYAHSVIGSMEDLDQAELPEVQEFFDLYYTPNNATLAVVGDFDPEVARSLVQEYFGGIARGGDPPQVACEDPFSHLPVEMDVPDPNAQLPGVWISYGAVPRSHPDGAALTVLSQVLGSGQASRLYQRLVREEQVAVQTGGFATLRLGPGLVTLLAVANQGVEAETLVESIDQVVARIREEGITEEELDRARNQVRASAILGRQTVMGRAEALQSANHFFGTPEAIRTQVEAVDAVTLEEVLRVANEYLTPENRAVIRTRPGVGQEDLR